MAALSPAQRAGGYSVQGWQTEDGLPSGRVHAVMQSRDGYLWVGTSQGLARFDGHRFAIYDSTVHPELVTPFYQTLAQTPDGALWFGASGGLYRLHEGRIKSYTVKDGLPTTSIRILGVRRDGSLYVGATAGRHCFIRDGRVVAPGEVWAQASNSIRCYLERADGSQYVGSVSGLWRIKGDTIEKLTGKADFPATEVLALAEGADGALWIGSNVGVRCLHADGRVEDFGEEQGLGNDNVQSLYFDRDGNLWIGTSGGLFRMRGGRVTAAPYTDSIGTATIFEMCEDSEGSLWIASSAGLFRLKDAPFHGIGKDEGLDFNSVYAVCESRDGSLWIGTMGGGVYRYDEENGAVRLPAPPEMNLDLIYSLYEEPDGTLWIGANAGFARYRDGQFTDFYQRENNAQHRADFAARPEEISPKIAFPRITGINSDGSGGLWLSANGALYRYQNGGFRGYTERDGLPANTHTMRSLLRARNGDIWVTTTQGAARLRDGKFTVYTTADGLCHNDTRSSYEDKEGAIWVSTESGGLNRLKDDKWRSYTTKDGLYDDFNSSFLEDDNGYFWIGGTRGIMRIARQEFDDFDAKRIRLLHPRLFTRHDGMPSSTCNSEGSPNAWKIRDGRLLFPTVRGIAVINPKAVPLNTVIPPVHIERGIVNNSDINVSGPFTIPPGDNDIQFHYTAISLLAPEKVRFRVRLSPLDRDWRPLTDHREIQYVNLPPGSYVFRVIASNSDGIWNEQGASIAFTVHPFFYQTSWFRIGVVFGVLFLGAGIYRQRVRRMRRRSEELQRQNLELERRIAERTVELARSNESLHASEYFYHSLVESLPQIIVRKDPEGRFTYANAAFAELIDCPYDQIVGRFDRDVYPPELAAKYRADDLRIMETRQSMEYENVVEKEGQKKRYLHVKKVPLYDDQNRPIGVQMLFWDMTVFRETEEKLKEAQKELVEISRMAGMAEVASGVLHNIGNVLNSVNTSATLAADRVRQLRIPGIGKVAQLLIEQGDRLVEFFATDPRGQKVPSYLAQLATHLESERDDALHELQALCANVEQIKEIVVAQRSYTHVSGFAEVMAASELVEFALGICEGSLARHRIAATREFMPTPPVKIQRQKALQIIISLIRNAKDAINETGRTDKRMTVGLHVSPEGNVQISVTDNGIGIAPENLTRIFAFGFSTKKGGHGFGLHSSTLAAKELGGSLSALSDGLGKGATFIFELPPADRSPLADASISADKAK